MASLLVSFLLALPVPGGTDGPDGPVLSEPLFAAAFDDGPGAFALPEAGGRVDAGCLHLGDARAAGTEAIAGDVEIVARVAAGAGTALVGLDGAFLVEAVRGAGPVPADGPYELRVVVRGGAAEATVGGAPLSFRDEGLPFRAAALVLGARDGEIAFDDVTVRRLPWFDGVRVDGIAPADLAALRDAPRERFGLLEPAPTRLDPTFWLALEGRAAPVTLRMCGERPDEAVVPLLDQALALAQIRPWLRVTIREQDQVLAALDADGEVRLPAHDCVAVVEAFVGHGDHVPTITLLDQTNDQVLDFGIPGGPMGRDLDATIPPGCAALRVEMMMPGRGSVTRTVTLIRP